MAEFTPSLLSWYKKHGRHDLPWQQNPTCYRVWVSEIMLQQTQVTTVIPYYQRFMQAFPDINKLAAAEVDEVLHLWTGLGYYARARNLHKAANTICSEHKGEFPESQDELINLPGIGRSTAAAILSLSLNQPLSILDGNVKRVLCRYHAVRGWYGEKKVENQLWQLAESHTPLKNTAEYTQAIMDLGATLCRRSQPDCEVCPVRKGCQAYEHGLQAELPEKKPKKAKPVKQSCFALIENKAGEFLLARRPPAGIWGGLWGFPEFASKTELDNWLENRGIRTKNNNEYPQIRHTFSHFHLDITPLKYELKGNAIKAVEDKTDECWYKPDGDLKLGMAAPVKKLINELFSSEPGETE
ncbi:MAG: A/G-specific adenine glycosylase [Gammaproteobacteria bacterium]|nr:A/G-specific adenine glycosylase [Gammaproteobacteria bacterium]